MKMIDKIWLLPLILIINVILAFASISARLFPLPYYLSIPIPYLVTLNIILIIYIGIKQKDQLIKGLITSIFSLGLAYLWSIQTA